MKKVPGPRVRVPLPRQDPVLQGVGAAVAEPVPVEAVLVMRVPSEHWVAGADMC